MSVQSLPSSPSFESLRKQAKALRRAVRAGDPAALQRVAEFHPRAPMAAASFSLSEAQLVVGRSYGFPSWSRLKQHVAVLEQFSFEAPENALAVEGSAADRFVRLACLNYGNWQPSFASSARRMLAERPELANVDVYAAAAVGDVDAVRAALEQKPALLNRKGGALGWEPLLYACYSRLDSPREDDSTLEVARLLLSRGADPDAGFLWGGNVPPFTALTGAFGEGEGGNAQPPHRDRDALARLLLDAGADPNDGQTLYNLHFRESDHHLELLLSYGLGQQKNGRWYQRFGDRMQSPARLLVEELWSAARKNYFRRVKLLLANGAEINTPGLRDGRTPYEAAVRAGNQEIAEYLLEHGARKVALDPTESFAAACIAGRRDEVALHLTAHPQTLEKLGPHGRVELLQRAVEGNRADGVRLMAELGFELSRWTRHDGVGLNLETTPMHNAAWAGNLEMVRLLLDLGADPAVRDATYHSTPMGWAHYNRQQNVVDYLMQIASLSDAVAMGGVDRARTLLETDASLIHEVDKDGDPVVFHLLSGARVIEMAELLREHGADFTARHHTGRSLLEMAQARGDHELMAWLSAVS